MELVSCQTARLTLRNLREGDFDAVVRYRCDPETFRYIGEPMTPEDVAAHIARCRDGWSRSDGESMHLAIELSGQGCVIGETMLRGLNLADRQAEFGIALGPRWRGQNLYALEALAGLFRYAFEDVGLHRLVGFSDVDNPSTASPPKLLGLQREGLLRHNAFRHGQWRDEYVVAVLEDDWPTVRTRCRSLLTQREP
ncbi:MAG TPA: GNAT family N-acetyltransferase [Candidatus Limnocylindrales bacterium]|nr:GNAT family N-acetyltransferase [Candidatus Limnocylindrales bacterium]